MTPDSDSGPPPVLRRAGGFWVATVVLGALTAIVGYATGYYYVTADAPSRDVARLIQSALALLVGLGTVGWWALELRLARRLLAGGSTARAWLTVLAVVTVLANVTVVAIAPAVLSPGGFLLLLLLIAQTAAVVTALVLMYRPAAGAYIVRAPDVQHPSAGAAPVPGPPPAGLSGPPPGPEAPRRGPLDP